MLPNTKPIDPCNGQDKANDVDSGCKSLDIATCDHRAQGANLDNPKDKGPKRTMPFRKIVSLTCFIGGGRGGYSNFSWTSTHPRHSKKTKPNQKATHNKQTPTLSLTLSFHLLEYYFICFPRGQMRKWRLCGGLRRALVRSSLPGSALEEGGVPVESGREK